MVVPDRDIPIGDQLIGNGNFLQGKEGWKLYVAPQPASASFKIVNSPAARDALAGYRGDVLRANVVNSPAHKPQDVVLAQRGFILPAGTYQLQFSARSAPARPMTVGVQRVDAENQKPLNSRIVNLGGDWKRYWCDCRSPSMAWPPGSGKLAFRWGPPMAPCCGRRYTDVGRRRRRLRRPCPSASGDDSAECGTEWLSRSMVHSDPASNSSRVAGENENWW